MSTASLDSFHSWRRRERLFAVFRRLWQLLELVLGYVPLTWTGLAVAGASYYVFSAFGEERADYVLYAAGLVGLSVVAASVFFVMLGSAVLLLGLRLRPPIQVMAKSIEVGDQVYSGFRFPRLMAWPFVELSMRWREPRSMSVRLEKKGRFYVELLSAQERGRHASVLRRFELRDIFGLSAFAFSLRYPAQLRVAPLRGRVDVAIAVRETGGDGYSHPSGKPEGEYIEMRGYQPGDPLRLVLWKTFARTRRLLVRVPERAITPYPSTVAFMVAGQGDEPTASAARTMMELGLLGTDYLFSADGSSKVVREADSAVEQLIDSVKARPQGGRGLARLVDQVDPVQLGNCVLFVPSHFGPWFEHVRAFAARLPAPPTLVLSVDGELEAKRGFSVTRLLRAEPRRVDELRAVPRLYDALSQIGTVQIVHAGSGRLIDVSHIEALRQL